MQMATFLLIAKATKALLSLEKRRFYLPAKA